MGWKGWENFDVPTGEQSVPASQPITRGKYKNVKTTVDGITFDSGREAKRWVALSQLAVAGHISGLKRQVSWALTAPNGKHLGDYVCDFTYTRDGRLVVEDAKGVRTELYKWKRKHFEAQYGLTILET